MGKVLGKNVVLYADIGFGYQPFACARTVSINKASSFIETSVKGSGIGRTYRPVDTSYTVNMTGIVNIATPGMVNHSDVNKLWQDLTIIYFRYQRNDASTNYFTDEGRMFVSGITDDADISGVNGFTYDFQGTGDILQLFTVTPQPTGGKTVIKYEGYTPQDNDTVVNVPGTIGIPTSDMLQVFKGGTNLQVILLAPATPVGNEVVWDPATGNFTFGVPFYTGDQPPQFFYQV